MVIDHEKDDSPLSAGTPALFHEHALGEDDRIQGYRQSGYGHNFAHQKAGIPALSQKGKNLG